MNNPNRATAEEIFDIWYKGQHTVTELSIKYGWDNSSLSHAFTRILNQKTKEKKAEKEKASTSHLHITEHFSYI